jgi:hypothetical protein
MADITVRAPDGSIVEVPEDQYQTALNAGYQNVSAEEAQAAREQYAAGLTDTEALRQGVIEAEPGYSVPQAAAQKTLSAFTFGQYPGLDRPEEVAVGQRFAAEHPVAAFGAEFVGQLPLAVGLGAAGTAALGGVAGAGLAARAGVAAADFGVQAAVGGAQTEAEMARLELRDFNPTNAAVVGVFGEALGRTAAYGFSKGLGFSRNLLARGEQRAVAQDSADSLGRGGLLNDFRVAAHAETYQNELSKLAADDLDRLETAFGEVGRQDRKRLRVAKLIEDLPEPQAGVRVELVGAYQQLYDGLLAEVGEGGAPAPARRLLDQLRGRIDALSGGDAPVGRKLWRQLDENRQALQEYAQDLHTSYDNAPGSAWLSRDGLRLLDDATRQTREALLREDAWGAAAAREQAAYNDPFTKKFFPNDRTVRGKLFFQSGNNERGFPKFRGDPGRVRQLFRRSADDVDAARLDEQFGEWLDGVEAIARAGERDTPAAASEALEAIRRLRKARSHAQFVQSVSERVSRRADAAEVIIGAGAGLALAGPAGAVFGGAAGQAARGLRLANWLARAARRVGWAGSPESMAELLGRGALPARQGPNVPTTLTDDVLDSAPPTPGGRTPPPGGPGAPPAASAAPGGPAVPPAPGAPPGGAQAVADAPPTLPSPAAPAAPGGGVAALIEDKLTQREFKDVVQRLRATGAEESGELADLLTRSEDDLVDAGWVDAADDAASDALAAMRRFEETPSGASSGDAVRRYDAVEDARAELRAQGTYGAAKESLDPEAVEALVAEGEARVIGGRVYARGSGAAAGRQPSAVAEAFNRRGRSQAHAAVLEDLKAAGLEIRMGADRVDDTVETLFGGRPPSADLWRQVVPLQVLSQIAPPQRARIDILGDALMWSAEGPLVNGEHAWQISRTFSRDDAGRLEVHHDHFFVADQHQGSGVGAEALKSMMGAYKKIGVDVVTVDSVAVGRYFWPSIGFNHPNPEVVQEAVGNYADWLLRQGKVATEAEAAQAIRGIRSMPALAQAEYGKDFLLSQSGPWNYDLRLDLADSNPLFHLMRGRLDLAMAGGAAVAGGLQLEGEPPAPTAAGDAPAAAAPGAGFAATAGLFSRARTKLVANVARKLFSTLAEPTLRTTARLVYSREQLQARRAEIQSWTQDPNQLVARVAEGLRDAPPEVFASTSAAMFRTASFLRDRLPQSGRPAPVAAPRAATPVSADAAAKYARYEQAALEPGEALREAAETRYLTPELMETLEELYPDLLAELRVAAYQAIQDGSGVSSVQAKTQYARLFGGDGTLASPAFSPTATKAYAYAYEQSAMSEKPQAAPAGPRPGVSNTAAAVSPPRPWQTG